MTTIYLIRHAAAEGNLYRVAHGQFNSTIIARGYRQLAYLRRRFDGVALDAVYGSDLLRAQTTASALYVPRGLTYRADPRMREVCMGVWEQLTWGEIARADEEMYYNFNNRPDLWQIEGGECFEAVRERMLSALRDIAAAHPGGTVAAVSHGAALRVLLGTLEGLSLQEIGKTPYGDNTAVSVVEIEGDTMRLVSRDDADHIPGNDKVRRHGVKSSGSYAVVATQPGLWFRPLRSDAARCELEAMLGEERVGRVAFCVKGAALHITEYELFPARRGQYYSVQLLGQAVKYARAHNLEDIKLWCGNYYVPYFERCGFTVTGNGVEGIEMTLDIRRVIREIPEIEETEPVTK